MATPLVRTPRAEGARRVAAAQPVLACIAFGGNLGDVLHGFRTARRALLATPGIAPHAASALYRTAPVGFLDQADFINAVLAVRTHLTPSDLLTLLLGLERQQGRTRGGERNGPRPLDLDLLLHGETTMETAALTLPHPRMAGRAFVLAPLCDVLGADYLLKGASLAQRLEQCAGQRVLRFATPEDWS